MGGAQWVEYSKKFQYQNETKHDATFPHDPGSSAEAMIWVMENVGLVPDSLCSSDPAT